MTELALLGLAFGAVYALGPWVVNVCRQRGLVAPICNRSSHTTPTPHGGGVLLPLVAVPLGLLAVWWLQLPHDNFLYILLLASLGVAFIGWRDDHAHLDPQLRLAVHLPAVALALAYLPPLFDVLPQAWVLPWWVEKLILLLAWGWFVNLYNFMDGADGLASGNAVFVACAVAVLAPPFAPLALLVAAAAAGLQRVNGAPARVFLGDVGSTWLGFMLGGLLLVAAADNTWQQLWPLMTVTLVFCSDATSTLIRRVAHGQAPWVPHKTFWFHRALALGLTHRQLSGLVLALNLALLALALGSLFTGWPELGFALGLLLMTAVAWYIRAHEHTKRTHHSS
jgi:UDP-N-acetylmuramyl pentapeptide phosphotransferase/UDP-N-acetylglucosamine-1-phosphate transferase